MGGRLRLWIGLLVLCFCALATSECVIQWRGAIGSTKTFDCSIEAMHIANFTVRSFLDYFKFTICSQQDYTSGQCRAGSSQCLNYPQCTYRTTALSSTYYFQNSGDYTFIVSNENLLVSGTYQIDLNTFAWTKRSSVVELGPYSVGEGDVDGVQYRMGRYQPPIPAFNGGAVSAIAPHPVNPNIIYIGTVNGGIWKTNDGGSHWNPLTDSMPSLSISHVSFDRNDQSFNSLVASVATLSSYRGSGGISAGIYITSDGGNTWLVPSEEFFEKGIQLMASYQFGNKIVSCVYQTLNETVTNRILVSQDYGRKGSWFATGPVGNSKTQCTSMIHVEGSSTLVASFVNTPNRPSSGEIWISNDEGLTWNQMTNFDTLLDSETLSAIRVSVSGGILYSLASGFGINEVEVRFCTPLEIGCSFRTIAGIQPILDEAQGKTNTVILADSGRIGTFYLGGDAADYRLQRCVVTDFDLEVAACEKLIDNCTIDGSAPHADSRCMVLDADGNLLEGDDGGIWKRTQPTSNQGKWLTLSTSLRAVECHSGAYDPASQLVVCGAQDNGVSMGYKHDVWLGIVGGDGGKVRLDSRSSPSQLYASSENFGYEYECRDDNHCHCVEYSRSLLRTFSLARFPYKSQSSAKGVVYQPIKQVCVDERGFPFYPIFEINQQTPLPTVTMVVLGSNGIYEISGSTVTTLARISNPNGYGDLVVGGMDNGAINQYIIWAVAGYQGVWFRRTSGLLSKTSLSTPPYRPALSVDQDPTDSSHAYVLTEVSWSPAAVCIPQVWKTINSGSTFVDITGDFDTVYPTERLVSDYCFQTISVVRSIKNTNVIVVGGISGLYYAEDEGDPSGLHWAKVDLVPSVVVTETRVDHVNDFLLVSTLGRGVWRIDSISYLIPFFYNNNTAPSLTPMFSPTATAKESSSASSSASTSLSPLGSPSVSESITLSAVESSTPSESLTPSPEESPTSSESITPSIVESSTPSALESVVQSSIESPASYPTITPTQVKKTHPVSSSKKSFSSSPSLVITTPSDSSSEHSKSEFPYLYLFIGLGGLIVLIVLTVVLVIVIVKRRQYQLLSKVNYQQSTLDDPENDSI